MSTITAHSSQYLLTRSCFGDASDFLQLKLPESAALVAALVAGCNTRTSRLRGAHQDGCNKERGEGGPACL